MRGTGSQGTAPRMVFSGGAFDNARVRHLSPTRDYRRQTQNGWRTAPIRRKTGVHGQHAEPTDGRICSGNRLCELPPDEFGDGHAGGQPR